MFSNMFLSGKLDTNIYAPPQHRGCKKFNTFSFKLLLKCLENVLQILNFITPLLGESFLTLNCTTALLIDYCFYLFALFSFFLFSEFIILFLFNFFFLYFIFFLKAAWAINFLSLFSFSFIVK